MSRTETALDEERTAPDAGNAATAIPATAPGGAVDLESAGRLVVIRPASRIPRLDVGELWHYR